MKKLDDIQKQKDAIAHAEMEELKRKVRELSGNAEPRSIPLPPTCGAAISLLSTPASPGSRKRHCSQQLSSSAKDCRLATQPHQRSFADVATGSHPIQGTSSQAHTQVQAHAQRSVTRNTHTNAPGNAGSLLGEDTPWSQRHTLVEGIFGVHNNGAMREELEIALESINGEPFRGTISFLEAKHGIFGGCLGLSDNNYENFDGVRFGYKGCPVAIFKLVKAINVDELLPYQNFEFQRRSTRKGKAHVDVIACKIRGLRPPNRYDSHQDHHVSSGDHVDDGTRNVTIDGCEYRVTKESLIDFLSCYGVVTSDILEVVYKDGTSGGSNRTGSYSVQVKLTRDLPQLAPIMGKRVKFFYKGIQKLCPNCFGPHPKKVCNSRKELWIDYVENFIRENANIPEGCYGRWIDVLKNSKSKIDTPLRNTLGTVETRDTNAGAPSATAVVNDEAVPPTRELPHSQATAEWLLNVSDVDDGHQKPPVKNSVAPSEADFMVPVNVSEHNAMVDRLTLGGSTKAEAEQIIAARRSAFKKATTQFKKSLSKTSRGGQRRVVKNSKPVENSQDENGY